MCEVLSFISLYILHTNIMHWKHVWNTYKCDKVQSYEWMNVTWILYLPISMCVNFVFNAQYQCVKCMNYEWANVTQFPFLNYEMLSLWWCLTNPSLTSLSICGNYVNHTSFNSTKCINFRKRWANLAKSTKP